MAYGAKITAIASFDTSGHVVPLRVRVDGVALKVEHYTVISDRMGTIEYDLTVIDGELRKQLRVALNTRERIWRLVVPPYFDY